MHQCTWCGITCTTDAEYVRHMSNHIREQSEKRRNEEEAPGERLASQSNSDATDKLDMGPMERQVPPHVSTPPLGVASSSLEIDPGPGLPLWEELRPCSPVHSASSPEPQVEELTVEQDVVKSLWSSSNEEAGTRCRVASKREKGDSDYHCDVCNEAFTNAVKLRCHQKSHRKGPALKFEPASRRLKQKCNICHKEYCNPGNLRKHLLSHVKSEQRKKDLKAQASYSCKFCKEMFTQDELQEHIQTHSREQPFQCTICEKSFLSRRQLVAHNRRKCQRPDEPEVLRGPQSRMKVGDDEAEESSDDKRIDDSDQSSEYSPSGESEPEEVLSRPSRGRKLAYQDTSKTPSMEDRPFMCEVCGKTFSVITRLNRHAAIHSGKSKYQCHICLRFLNRKDQLKIHVGGRRCKPVKSSSMPPPEQPVMPVPEIRYRCIVCKNMFDTKADYVQHKEIHTQAEFEQAARCPYPKPEENFVGASDSVIAKSTDQDEGRIYPCPNCALVFEEQTTLNRHFLTHTGQKCFRCRFCQRQFSARRGLVFHVSHSCKQKPPDFKWDEAVKDSQEETDPDSVTEPQLAYNAAPMVPLQPGPVVPINAPLAPAQDPINTYPASHSSQNPCPDPASRVQQVTYHEQQSFGSDSTFPYNNKVLYSHNQQYNNHPTAKPSATYSVKDGNVHYQDGLGFGANSQAMQLDYTDKHVVEYYNRDNIVTGNTQSYGSNVNTANFETKSNVVNYENNTNPNMLGYVTKPITMDYVSKPTAMDFLDKSIGYLRHATHYTSKVAETSYPSWPSNAASNVSHDRQTFPESIGVTSSETGHVLSNSVIMSHTDHTSQPIQAVLSQSMVSVSGVISNGGPPGSLTAPDPQLLSTQMPYATQVLPASSNITKQASTALQSSATMLTYTPLRAVNESAHIESPPSSITHVPPPPPSAVYISAHGESTVPQNTTQIQSSSLNQFPNTVSAAHSDQHIVSITLHQPSPTRPVSSDTSIGQQPIQAISNMASDIESSSGNQEESRRLMDCPTCGCSFKQVYYFIKHFETSKCAKAGGPVTCKVCGDTTVPFEDYVTHVRRHDGLDTYTCSLCFRMYTSSLRYAKHRSKCEAFMKSMGALKSDSKDKELEISGTNKNEQENVAEEMLPESESSYLEADFTAEGTETLSLQQLEAVGISTLASIESRTLRRNPHIMQQEAPTSVMEAMAKPNDPNNQTSDKRLLHRAAPVDLGNGTRGFESESSWWELGTGTNFGFRCQVAGCGAILSSKYHLMRHVKSVHSGEEKVVCDICSKTYSSKHSLNTHMLTHSQEKRHKCRYCNTRFRLAATLKRHERRHTGERPHKCPVCAQCFIDISELNRHLSVHNIENPFTCGVCGESFPRKKMLIYHVKVHRGPRKAKPIHCCPACEKRFTCKRSLGFHMRTHTGEKPYECEFCHERFTWLSSYHRHVGQHIGRVHACQVCQKTFSSLPGLKEHMVSHTDRRDFACQICGKTFAKRKCWKQHLRVHEGKRHVCTVCGSAFSEVYYLNRHMKIHAPSQQGAS